MKYSESTISKALSILDSRRKKAEALAQKRKEEFIQLHPEYGEIEEKLAQTGLAAVRSILERGDPVKTIEALKRDNLKFQQARKAFLEANGLKDDYFEPEYTCKRCKDTGYIDGRICRCYEELLRKLSIEELACKTPLQLSSFDDFDVSLQKDPTVRKKMESIYNFCKEYADDFDVCSDSLFMYGETGLGKTHLSLAIAAKVIEKGYVVVYGSAQDFFNMIERERFGRSDNPDGTTEEKLFDCDLLIIDDLGSEFVTQFTIAELYSIINTRLASGAPTIINSNISLDQLEKQYNSRITSRIIGTYKILNFVGNDVRQIK